MSDDQITVEVDGVEHQARKGQMLIEVTDAAGVYVPRFCYHSKLSVAANCRMCLVEVERAPKPMPACATPVMDGMKVSTRSAQAIAAQRATMEFLLINHPLDCPICDQGGECELQDLALGFGRDISRYTERKRVVKDKNLGPLVSTDMTRCIHCTRCVRFGQEIGGIQELGTLGRGENMEIGTYVEKSVGHELSGNIIDLCPVGALNSKPFRYRGRSWEMVQQPGIAPHDSVGSHIHAHVLRGKLMRVVPRECEEINETWLSDRDRFSCEGVYADDRVTRPMVRVDGEWHETGWSDALDQTTNRLRAAIDEHGAERTGVLAAPTSTLEELYLLQKLFRALGVSNLDHRLRRVDFSDQASDPLFPWLGQSIAELQTLDSALLVGANIRKEAPIIAHRLRKAALAGGRVMFLNPAGFEFNFTVTEQLDADGGQIVAQLAALVAAAEAGAELPQSLRALIGSASVEEQHHRIVENLRQGEKSTILLGHLAQRHPHYGALRGLGVALAGATGARFGQVAEAANSAGACLAGVLPHRGAGGAALDGPGRDAASMLAGDLKVLVLFGVEPESDCADQAAAISAMQAADCVISLAPFASETLRAHADILLPVGTFVETAGTFVNTEGRHQPFAGIAKPYGESRPGWKVLRVMGNSLGVAGFDQQDVTDVRTELAALIGDLAGGDGPGAGADVQVNGVDTPRMADIPMYATDALVRRSAPLQATADGQRERVEY